jgi:hypothetical protein
LHKRGSTLFAAIATVLALGASAGCSEDPNYLDDPALAPPSATETADPADQQLSVEVIKVYNLYRETEVKAQLGADFRNPDLAKYTTDPLLGELRQELLQKAMAGVVAKGRPVWHPEVVKIEKRESPYVARIEDCYDATNWDVIDSKTGKSVAVEGQPRKFLMLAEAVQGADKRWMIRRVTEQRERSC